MLSLSRKKRSATINKIFTSKLVTAGAFPTVDELMRVESLNVPYQVTLSEVFQVTNKLN